MAYLVRCEPELRRAQALIWWVWWRSTEELRILLRAQVPQGLMRALRVIPLDPPPNRLVCFLKRAKLLLPHTFFFQRSKPALNEPILFRCMGRDEFLRQAVKPTRLPKAPTLKDEAIITTHNRHLAIWPQRPKPCQARHFERPFCFIGPSA